MADPQHVDPGYFIETSMEDLLARRAAAQFAREKFQAEEARHAAELRERQEENKARREDLLQRAKDRETSDFEKRLTGMVRGDVMDPTMRAQAVRLGFGHTMETPPEVPGVPLPEGQEGPVPPVQPPPTFVGTREERLAEQTRGRQQKFVETLPSGSPERRALEAEAAGLKVPPKFFGGTSADDEAVARQNRSKGIVERLVNGQWVPVTGNMPKGTHWMTEPEQKDTSAEVDRRSRRMDALQEHAINEFKDTTTKLEGQMTKLEDVGKLLNQNTAQSDALVAPLILGATVGGQGSGFRMTRAEIDKVLQGRTKWESLRATLNTWETDPQHFAIPPEQREAMRALGRAIRAKAYDLHSKVMDMRLKAVEEDDPKALLRMRTQVHMDMFPAESAELGTESEATPEGLPAVGGMFRGSKVLGIREKK